LVAAGNSPQLLSLSATVYSFTGGAHPNTDFTATLWDRESDEAVAAATLLGPGILAGLTPRFCDALDGRRAEIREEDIVTDARRPVYRLPDTSRAGAGAGGHGR
jgi:hypothetical protein